MTTTLSSSSSGPEYGSLDEDVERRAGDLARAKRGEQRVLVEQLAAGGVHDPHAGAHRRERGSVEEPRVSGVSGRWSVRKSAAS